MFVGKLGHLFIPARPMSRVRRERGGPQAKLRRGLAHFRGVFGAKRCLSPVQRLGSLLIPGVASTISGLLGGHG